MTVLDRVLPKSFADHPKVLAVGRTVQELQEQLDAAMARGAALSSERDGLADRSVATMIGLGKVKPSDVEARAARLTSDLSAATAEIARLQAAVGQAKIDSKVVVAEAREDMRTQIAEEAGALIAEMERAFSSAERASARLTELAQYKLLEIPSGTIGIVLGYVAKWRTETARLRSR
jgi:hypothetical protein